MESQVAQEHRLDNACVELRKLGYDSGTFDFEFIPGLAAQVATSGAAVVVTCNDQVQKLYDAGGDSSWPQEFCDDLRAGLFGPPPAQTASG